MPLSILGGWYWVAWWTRLGRVVVLYLRDVSVLQLFEFMFIRGIIDSLIPAVASAKRK